MRYVPLAAAALVALASAASAGTVRQDTPVCYDPYDLRELRSAARYGANDKVAGLMAGDCFYLSGVAYRRLDSIGWMAKIAVENQRGKTVYLWAPGHLVP